MNSQILPISNPSSSLAIPTGAAATMFLTSQDDLSATRLLISPQFDDDKPTEVKPFLPRSSSFTTTTTTAVAGSSPNFYQKRRRRTASDNSFSFLSGNGGGGTGRGQAFREGFGCCESITRLCSDLWRYLGYKAWGSLLGQQLSDRDIIVACIDYRNFPQGTMSDMVQDASQGISFVCNHIAEYGGDPNRIYLMGQSAGAHIAACALLEQAIKESGEGESTSWSVSQINAYFGLSGGYNLLNLVDYFHSRGLYRSIFLSIMEGEQSLPRFSPEVMVQDPNIRNAVSLLPPIVLFHGTGDYSIPSDASKNFADTLQRLGVKAESVLYEGRTHTDLFLQDPMRGGKDQLFEDLVGYIHAGDAEALAKDAIAPPRKRLVPEFMLKLARAVSPF
ncbi:hypothetical protein ACSBR2_036051 [Camellia fascicularis]